jgi:hypothetical protein
MDHGQLPKKSQTSGLNGGFIGQLMVYDPNRQGAIGEANLAVGSTTGTAAVESLSAKRAKQSNARLRPMGTPTHLGIDNPMTIRFLRRLARATKRAPRMPGEHLDDDYSLSRLI